MSNTAKTIAAQIAALKAENAAMAQAPVQAPAEVVKFEAKPKSETPAPAPAPVQAQPSALELEIAKLRAENEALKRKAKARAVNGLSFRVSEKGALSVYGLGRFPVTLYGEQWTRLLAQAEEIKQFMADNAAMLKTKGGE